MNTPDNRVAMENDLPRVDIRQKLTGKAVYARDVALPKMLHARFVRFPHGAGRVVSANVEAAKKVPGVLEVEVDTRKKARYVGERLGHVVATSEEALEDAIDALALKVRIDGVRADVSLLLGDVPDREPARLKKVYARAAAVVEATYRTQVQTHSALETHGCVVDYRGDRAEAWASTQGTSGFQSGLTSPLRLDASQVVVHCEYVGGGFGAKFGPGPEGDLAASLSRKYKRPVKAFLTRREEHLDSGNRPGSVQFMKIAAAKDGKLLGGRIHCTGIVGFAPGGGGVRNPLLYDFGDIVRTEDELELSSGRPRAFRAPGHPQGVFAVESMLDELAAKLGIDPVQMRKVNETSDRRRRQLDQGARLIGWSQRKPDGTWPGRVKRGFGCGGTLWYARGTRCEALVEVFRSGKVVVSSGVQDIGTGTFTVVADVAAESLGIDRKYIDPRVGDSRYPPGPGSGGSTVTRAVAPAIMDAAAEVRGDLTEAVAKAWKVPASKVKLEGGRFVGPGGKTASWEAGCGLLPSEKITARGRIKDRYVGKGDSDGVQFAMVDVDTETGVVTVRKIVAVQACGKVVNRLTAENQVNGAVIQGVSYALFEDRLLDRNTGGMLNDDLEGYKIVGAADVPEIVVALDVTEADTGVRGLGEPPTIPTSGAIANAVANAIGVRVRELPITPKRVLEALAGGGR